METKEDIFDLSVSEKENEFVKYGLNLELEVAADIVETVKEIPYIGSLIKLGRIGGRYFELRFIRKLAKFLEKELDIPEEEKEKFLASLGPKKRKILHEYLTQYLLHAEDSTKADIMGYIYKERVRMNIDDKMFLRLCSIIDRAFVFDLCSLSEFVKPNTNTGDSIEANNFINLGLIDNFVGGVWVDEPTYKLNPIGLKLHQILEKNKWYEMKVWDR